MIIRFCVLSCKRSYKLDPLVLLMRPCAVIGTFIGADHLQQAFNKSSKVSDVAIIIIIIISRSSGSSISDSINPVNNRIPDLASLKVLSGHLHLQHVIVVKSIASLKKGNATV